MAKQVKKDSIIYDIRDVSEIERLNSLNRCITKIDVDNVHHLYKKYIDSKADFYKYSNIDRVEILRLAKVAVAQINDLESIYSLYKKYIKPNAAQYKTNCNCSTSISRYYQDLLNWYSANGFKFDIDCIDIDDMKNELKIWYNVNIDMFK